MAPKTPSEETLRSIIQAFKTASHESLSGGDGADELHRLLTAQISEYVKQHEAFQASPTAGRTLSKASVTCGEEIRLQPPPDEAEAAGESLRQWCSTYVCRLADLDARLPRLQLQTEQMRKEVSDALVTVCGASSMRKFATNRLLKRCCRLRSQVAMIAERLSGIQVDANASTDRDDLLSDPRWTGLREGGAPQEVAWEAAVKMLEKEVTVCSQRLRLLESDISDADLYAHPLWSSGVVVLLREILTDSSATSAIRRFLGQLQYLGYTHRATLWKRSLELRACLDTSLWDETGRSGDGNASAHSSHTPSTPGEGNGSGGTSGIFVPRGAVPLGVASRRLLECALQKLGPAFGCTTSIHVERGKSFADLVAMSFPEFFEKQQKRLRFQAYPVGGALGAAPVKATDEEEVDGGGTDMAAVSMASTGLGDAEDEDVWYLRACPWATDAPWKARIDSTLAQQAFLLRASHAAEKSPVRLQHREESYAQQLVHGAMDRIEPRADVGGNYNGMLNGGKAWEADVDMLLRTEMAFVGVGDGRMIVRRLSEVANGRSRADRAAAEMVPERQQQPPTTTGEPLPQHLLRAYYLLRHLHCRAQRWRLLELLNFYRFLQRRMVAGLLADAGVPSPHHSTTASQGQRQRSGNALRYWDLSSKTLDRAARRCAVPFSVEASNGGGNNNSANQSSCRAPLDRENTLRTPGDLAVITLDNAGRKVMHELALNDLAALEREMLSIGSYYVHKFEAPANKFNMGGGGGNEIEQEAVDRIGVLDDLYAAEVWFNLEKVKFLEFYMEIYEHTSNPPQRREIEQRIVDVMMERPALNLEDAYFTDAYAASISMLNARANLMQSLLSHQIRIERTVARAAFASATSGPAAAAIESEKNKRRRKVEPTKTRSDVERTDDDDENGLDVTLAALAHPCEGHYCCSDGTGALEHEVILTTSAEPVAVDEFCLSAQLAWKAELVIDAVHSDLVTHFRPSSAVAVTLLRRICYTFAADQWSHVLEEENGVRATASGSSWRAGSTKSTAEFAPNPVRQPHDDPEMLLLIVRQVLEQLRSHFSPNVLAKTTRGAAQVDGDDDENRPPTPIMQLGGLDVGGFLNFGFSELRRQCGSSEMGLTGGMLANLLEHVHTRLCLRSTMLEVLCLEKTLRAQASACSIKVEALRPVAIYKGEDQEEEVRRIDSAVDPLGFPLSAGMLHAEFAHLVLDKARLLGLYCSPRLIQELRHIYQHELAFRNLVLACVRHNVRLCDPQIRQREISYVLVVGPPREMLANDLFSAASRQLRETTSLSGHLLDDCRGKGPQQRRGKITESPAYVDLAQHARHVQLPFSHINPVLAAVAGLWEEKRETLSCLRTAEAQRQTRILWHRLLCCSSLCMNSVARALAVRIQAADAAIAHQGVTALIPAKITPFVRDGSARYTLIDQDSRVGHIFSVPTPHDILLLPAAAVSDIPAAMVLILEQLSAGTGEERRPRTQESSKTPDEVVHDNFREAEMVMGISFAGPPLAALELLHKLTSLVVTQYTFATIAADPVALLRMHRFACFNSAEIEMGMCDVSDVLAVTEQVHEALEVMCSELARLPYRLEVVSGELARNPEHVLSTLHSELQAAHRKLAALLRHGVRWLLHDGASDDAARTRKWVHYLESMGHDADAKGELYVQPTGLHSPPAAVSAFAAPPTLDSDFVVLQATQSATQMRSFSDNLRQLHQNHPRLMQQCSPLHAFFASLLGVHGGDDGTAADWEVDEVPEFVDAEPEEPPFLSRLLRCQPEAPLVEITLFVHTLSQVSRQRFVKIHAEFREKRLACYALHGAMLEETGSKTDKAVAADAELFGSLMLLEILKEHVASCRLAVPPPVDRATLASCEAHIRALCRPVEKNSQDAKLQFREAAHLPSFESSSEEVNAELKMARARIRHLLPVMEQTLVAIASERLLCELTALVQFRHADMSKPKPMRREQQQRQQQQQPLSSSVSRGRAQKDLFAGKVDAILHALNRLRASGTYVYMDPDGSNGEPAYVLREGDLNICIEELITNLPQWGAGTVRSRERLVQDLFGYLRCRYAAHTENLCRIESSRAAAWPPAPATGSTTPAGTGKYGTEGASSGNFLERRESYIRSEAAARGCHAVAEVDRLHRVARDLQVASQELENRLNSEVWEKVRGAMTDLTKRLTAEAGAFQSGHRRTSHSMVCQMRDIREHLTTSLAMLSSRCYRVQVRAVQERPWREETPEPLVAEQEAMQRRQPVKEPVEVSDGMYEKLKELARRDDPRVLRLRIVELQDQLLCARFFHHFKLQALQQQYEEHMESLRMTLDSNKQLSEKLARASHAERDAAEGFTATARQMSVAEKRIEALRTEVESNSEKRQRLQNERNKKTKQLSHISKEVKRHQSTGAVDVDHILGQIEHKSQLLAQLELEDAEHARELEQEARQNSKHMAKLRRKLQAARAAKEEVRENLNGLYAEVERGGLTEAERLKIWRGRIAVGYQRLQELREENDRLRRYLPAASFQGIEGSPNLSP